MLRYTIKRVLLMFPTLLGAAVLVFFLLRIVPGDICEVRFGGVEGGTYDTEAVEICREQNGLNEPLSVQFGRFIAGVVTLDFGVSMWSKHPIVDELGQRLPLSIQLTLMAMVVSIIIGIPLGIVAALRQDTWLDYLARSFSVVGIAVPSFWFGIMIIVGLLVSTHLLFDQPWMPPLEYTPFFDDPISNLEQMIWPALAVGYRFSASLTRWTRSALLEILHEDYVRTARAKGLLEKIVTRRHALRNALLPVVTILGMEFAALMSGLVVTEQVFNLNGIGKWFVVSIDNHDFTSTQMLVMLFALIFVVTNFVVDMLYAWLDPRIRYS